MRKKIQIILVILFLAALGNGMMLLQSGLWRKMVSDDYVWKKIQNNGSYEAYLKAATQHFDDPTTAKQTQTDWAITYWRNHPNVAIQKFKTKGIIFELQPGREAWKIKSISTTSKTTTP